ncbi:hypothetical protein DEN96_07625 [Escherichia coli]|nr:hypothetical protein C7235_19060 [Escherichia coli]QCH63170.1 hypothetical protein CAX06_019700 [Escherichia coli O91:H21]EEW8815975.1 hypothetical protein [Escherichia coli]EFN9225244.1 hypothetical protein [Escherichia coli]EFN9274271.1 hypothetical protein [Escherichia coli]
MRRYARLIRPTVYGRSVGRIRRSRRIRQSCAMPDATLCASYHAYGLRAKCRRIRRSRRIRQSCTIINAYSVYWRGRQYARQ